jgi:hypothetical protein
MPLSRGWIASLNVILAAEDNDDEG